MTYAGLTTADKGALLDAQKYGKWIAKDASGTLYAYHNKPVKKSLMGEWYYMTWVALNWIYISFIHWDDPDPVNIDLALAQIAEMESKQKELLSEKASEKGYITWNERINQMTVEEKAKKLVVSKWVGHASVYIAIDNSVHDRRKKAETRNVKILNSPYTEGETE